MAKLKITEILETMPFGNKWQLFPTNLIFCDPCYSFLFNKCPRKVIYTFYLPFLTSNSSATCFCNSSFSGVTMVSQFPNPHPCFFKPCLFIGFRFAKFFPFFQNYHVLFVNLLTSYLILHAFFLNHLKFDFF